VDFDEQISDFRGVLRRRSVFISAASAALAFGAFLAAPSLFFLLLFVVVSVVESGEIERVAPADVSPSRPTPASTQASPFRLEKTHKQWDNPLSAFGDKSYRRGRLLNVISRRNPPPFCSSGPRRRRRQNTIGSFFFLVNAGNGNSGFESELELELSKQGRK